MRARKNLGMVAAVAVGTVALAACSGGSQPKAAAHGAAPALTSSSPTAGQPVAGQPVAGQSTGQTTAGQTTAGQSTDGAPVVDPSRPIAVASPGKALLQVAGRTGSDQPAVVPRVEPGTLSVEVDCTGPDKITVRLGTVMSFDVDCAPGTPETENDSVLDNALTDLPVSVHGAAANTWALTLGWSDVRSKPN